MQPRVTAVLVARNGAKHLRRTLEAVHGQSRRPDAFVVVDAASTDETAKLLSAAGATTMVSTRSRSAFGAAITVALSAIGPSSSEDEWLWLLAHDNAPDPAALAALLAAVEIAPSVAIAGPKLMRWGRPDTIAHFGESMTPFGTAVQLVSDELDQAQHDRREDLLAVAAQGMLVRRTVWDALGGFDRGLGAVDEALDFCVRARLAGHRVVAVPAARVASDRQPPRSGAVRAAQLHRRLVYAPAVALPLHWLSLLPLAVLRSVWQLAVKRPAAVPGELAAALGTAFSPGILSARQRLNQNRRVSWDAIASLRVQPSLASELAANRASAAAEAEPAVESAGSPESAESAVRPRPSYFAAGGAWITLLLAAVGIVSFGPFLNTPALAGGGLLPLASIAELWSNPVTADPFSWVLALLGSLTFWSPSTSVVALYLAAIPLAGLAAWAAAARFATRGWAPAVAAVAWALAPGFLASLHTGHLAAVIAHLLLPWLLLAVVNAARSWSAAGAAALLFAATVASAPILAPALLLGVLVWAGTHPTSLYRTIGIPVPAALLFAPLVIAQIGRGEVLGIFAEPGLPVGGDSASAWQLALGSPGGGSNGWEAVATALGLPAASALVLVAAMLAPLAALALLSLFLPGSRRAVPALALALLGFVTAVVGVHLELSHVGGLTTAIWPGAGLALYWLGLVGAAVIALEALASAAILPALLALVGAVAMAVPLLAAPSTGRTLVHDSDGRMLPAFVTAEAATTPLVGTLELQAEPGGALTATVHRGTGTTLDEQSTISATTIAVTDEGEALALLAGNLASHSGFDSASELERLGISFVLLPEAPDEAAATIARTRAADSLDSNDIFAAVGETDNGYLWRYTGEVAEGEEPASVGPWLVLLGVVFGGVALTALPTGTRRRPVAASSDDENPADTFEEDDSA